MILVTLVTEVTEVTVVTVVTVVTEVTVVRRKKIYQKKLFLSQFFLSQKELFFTKRLSSPLKTQQFKSVITLENSNGEETQLLQV